MNMGAMAMVGTSKLKNLYHILFNNESHDSVGAQPTVGGRVDFCKVAEACGYESVHRVETEA